MTYRFSALITKDGEFYVARCPELDVTSQGDDIESARSNLREAVSYTHLTLPTIYSV